MLPAQNLQSYPIMHCDIRPKRKDVGFLTCMEETVFQAFFAMRNKHAVSGSAIVYLGCDFAGERIEPCGPLESSHLTGKQLKCLSKC